MELENTKNKYNQKQIPFTYSVISNLHENPSSDCYQFFGDNCGGCHLKEPQALESKVYNLSKDTNRKLVMIKVAEKTILEQKKFLNV